MEIRLKEKKLFILVSIVFLLIIDFAGLLLISLNFIEQISIVKMVIYSLFGLLLLVLNIWVFQYLLFSVLSYCKLEINENEIKISRPNYFAKPLVIKRNEIKEIRHLKGNFVTERIVVITGSINSTLHLHRRLISKNDYIEMIDYLRREFSIFMN